MAQFSIENFAKFAGQFPKFRNSLLKVLQIPQLTMASHHWADCYSVIERCHCANLLLDKYE